MKSTEIICRYTSGSITLPWANAELKLAGSALHLDPEYNCLTEENRAASFAGSSLQNVRGFGLLDTGDRQLTKVEVREGTIVDPDVKSRYSVLFIAGKVFQVRDRKLCAA